MGDWVETGRNQAEDLEAGVVRGRFVRKAAFGAAPEDERVVDKAIARAKEGDRDAMRFLYVRYADSIYTYLCRVVRDEHEAEDLTQHVFAKLFTVLPKYERRAVPFSGWILRVAHNIAIDHMRRHRTIPSEEVRPPELSWESTNEERSRSLREALEGLPHQQRQVLVLRHVVGLSPGEIAEQLGKSEGSVHGLHHRGRRALQQALEDLDVGPATATRS
jgi:RNA polymerase sigma-70 factor, ECF subfamily